MPDIKTKLAKANNAAAVKTIINLSIYQKVSSFKYFSMRIKSSSKHSKEYWIFFLAFPKSSLTRTSFRNKFNEFWRRVTESTTLFFISLSIFRISLSSFFTYVNTPQSSSQVCIGIDSKKRVSLANSCKFLCFPSQKIMSPPLVFVFVTTDPHDAHFCQPYTRHMHSGSSLFNPQTSHSLLKLDLLLCHHSANDPALYLIGSDFFGFFFFRQKNLFDFLLTAELKSLSLRFRAFYTQTSICKHIGLLLRQRIRRYFFGS